MELRDYLQTARRRWKLLVGCVLSTIAIAALMTLQATPEYSSSARLFVTSSEATSAAAYQGSLLSAQRVSSYADLVTGQDLARRVIDRLQLDMQPSQLANKITATAVPETVILEISVTDSNPRQAQKLTQAVADELTALVSQLETPPGGRAAPIKVTIVDPASLPAAPASPQPVRNLGLAAMVGLLLGFGAAVVREIMDTSVRTHEDVTSVIDAPIMGDIAFDPMASKKPLITSLSPQAPRVEALRVVRTNLQFVNVDNDSKVIVVTSSVPEEGKTTTAANLAITLAQAGQRVALLEADLRRPKISDKFLLESAVGLTTVLIGRSELEEAMQSSSIPTLSVLTSGPLPPNPSELLQSHAMTDLLRRLRNVYDIVIVDAPPLLPVTDAAVLTAESDGALLVVRYGKTTKDQLRQAMERLRAIDARVLGAVLNMVRQDGVAGSQAAYGYSYVPAPVVSEVAGTRESQPLKT